MHASLCRNQGSMFGSLAKTSRPALETLPDCIASFKASSCTIDPRAVLMKKTPFFIASNSDLPIRLSVSLLYGQFIETTSEQPRSSCNVLQCVASYPASILELSWVRLNYLIFMLKASAFLARYYKCVINRSTLTQFVNSTLPMAPMPTIPKVRPEGSLVGVRPPRHVPFLILLSAFKVLRSVASIK